MEIGQGWEARDARARQKMLILIVDDEPNIRRTLRVALEAMGHAVEEAGSAAEALRLVERQRARRRPGRPATRRRVGPRPAGAAAGPVAPPGGGRDHGARQHRHGRRGDAPRRVRLPAQAVHARPGPRRAGAGGPGPGAARPGRRPGGPGPAPRSPRPSWRAPTRRCGASLDLARKVAPTDAAVLIRGESGTGKGVLARALHAWSQRADGPFVTVNCPSLSPELLESDLFGHVRGAFTGAVRDAAGKVAAAEGGHALPRRGRRPAAAAPAEAAAVPPGAEVRAGRRDQDPDGRRPPRRGDQP